MELWWFIETMMEYWRQITRNESIQTSYMQKSIKYNSTSQTYQFYVYMYIDWHVPKIYF